MFYELMNTDDRVFTITNDFLAIERCDGSVEIYPFLKKDKKIMIDTEAVTTIGYTPCDNETEEYTSENGVHIVNF